MTPTRRTLRTTGAAAVLAAVVLSGCTDEEPQDDAATDSAAATATSTSAPASTSSDDAATTTGADDDAAATSSPGVAAPSEPADDAAATSEAAPATEAPAEPTVLTSADESFTLEIPDGWEEALDLARENVQEEQQDRIVLATKELERKDDFFTNVVVTQEEYVGHLTSAVEETAKQLAGEDGEYEILEAVEVDGNRAPGYTVVRDVGGTTVHQTQRWISHEGTLYSVTLSAVEAQAEATEGLLDTMLASWTWLD